MILSKQNFPAIHPIGDISFAEPNSYVLKNGIKVFLFPGSKNDILSVDFLFDAGRWAEKKPLIGKSCSALIKSGTHSKSAFEMSETIDFYGSTIKASLGYNTFSIQLYCLHRYLSESLPLLKETIMDVVFPASEVDLFKKNSLSKLKMNQEKTDYLADMAFKKLLFGDKHPYGYETSAERIEGIEQIDIHNYYNSQLSPENCTILVSGRITDKIEKEIDTFFESLVWNKMNTPKSETIAMNTSAEKQFYLEKKGAVQASLNIGKILFNMNEPDYPEFLLTNTIFGGYFGSRLMSKIREEKGYTYGIHSSLQTLKHSGIFCIQTEIGVEHKKNCLEDIYNEIDKMNTDLVSDREIVLARNYLLGKFLSRIDGPLNRAEQFKKYYIEGNSVSKLSEFVEKIRSCDAKTIRNLSQKYLKPNTFTEVVVG